MDVSLMVAIADITELAQEDFNVFLGLASRLGYKVVKL